MAPRFIRVATIAVIVAWTVLPSPAGIAGPADGLVDTNAAPGGFMSDNVIWLGNIPIDLVGIGGRPADTPDGSRFFTTGAGGLSIYDTTTPERPALLGHLPLPHFENEDVSVSDDGRRVLLTADFLVYGFLTYVIDASTPETPIVEHVMTHGAHTITCVLADCSWVYTSESATYHIDAPGGPKVYDGSEGWETKVREQLPPGVEWRQGAHDHNRDAGGLIITDTVPRLVLDVTDQGTPLDPDVVAWSTDDHSQGSVAYQHNNMRPDADLWEPRSPAVGGGDLRPGELLLSNGETNFTTVPFYSSNPVQDGVSTAPCGDYNGPFATWNMANFDQASSIRPIEVFRPVTSNVDEVAAGEPANRPYMDGNPQLNASGCSGHWFDHLGADEAGDILVAASWYEHGTRILEVKASTGAIREVGFYQPVAGSAWASYWINDEIVYTVDVARGIDILRFDRDAPEPSLGDLYESWMAAPDPLAAKLSAADRLYCSLAVGRSAPLVDEGFELVDAGAQDGERRAPEVRRADVDLEAGGKIASA